MVWEHLSGGTNMFAVFDHVRKPGLGRAVSEKQVLKLVQDGHLLEEIDLENLSLQVRLDEEKSRSQQIQDSDRYVVLVIKRPAAALRYQLSTGEVRRIQMNFRPESGYDTAVNVFRAIGVPISDKNISPPASQGSLTRPVSQWSGQQGHVQMIPGTSLGSNHPRQYLSSDLGAIPSFDRVSNGSASSSQHIMSDQFNSGHSPTRALPGSMGLLPGLNVDERATTSYAQAFPSSITRSKSPERPATAPLTLTQLMPPRRELPFAKQPAAQGISSETVVEETPQKADKKPASRAKAKQTKQPSRPSSSRSKPTSASSKQDSGTEQSMIVRLKTGPTSDLKTTDPTFNLPIMPTTSAAKNTTTNPVLAEVTPNRPNTRSRNTASPFRTDPLQAPSRTNTETILPTNKENIVPINTTESSSANTKSIPQTTSKDITPEEYMTRLDHWVRKYQDLPAPTPKPKPAIAIPASTDKDDLAAFAAQPEKERLAAIDEMICEYLEDPNFATLCEDVEKSWKRIGLGF
ncbi:MAG: hypothetical protein Q9221_008810 [Calogaya cf. arnoldii]